MSLHTTSAWTALDGEQNELDVYSSPFNMTSFYNATPALLQPNSCQAVTDHPASSSLTLSLSLSLIRTHTHTHTLAWIISGKVDSAPSASDVLFFSKHVVRINT